MFNYLIVNVGDRVFFGYNSSELDVDAQQLLQDQAAWLKQYSEKSIKYTNIQSNTLEIQ